MAASRVQWACLLLASFSVHCRGVSWAKYPCVASIQRLDNLGPKPTWIHSCTGLVIENKIVLTVAHCLAASDRSDTRVVTSYLKFPDNNSSAEIQTVGVKYIHIHPGFSRVNLDNDFAVIVTDASFNFAPSTCRIFMPDKYSPSDDTCMLMRWEDNGQGNFSIESNLALARVKSLDNSDCRDKLWTIPARLSNPAICVEGEEDLDVRSGDSGMPLICKHGLHLLKRRIQFNATGILSWRSKASKRTYPVVYADIYAVADWINDFKSLA